MTADFTSAINSMFFATTSQSNAVGRRYGGSAVRVVWASCECRRYRGIAVTALPYPALSSFNQRHRIQRLVRWSVAPAKYLSWKSRRESNTAQQNAVYVSDIVGASNVDHESKRISRSAGSLGNRDNLGRPRSVCRRGRLCQLCVQPLRSGI